MRRIILFIVSLLLVQAGYTICDNSGIYIWPKHKEIATNSLFIIEGYGDSQELIMDLTKKNKVYMVCENETIYLEVIELNEGQMSLTQAILKPQKLLTQGKIYEMYMAGLSETEGKNFHRNRISWKVNNVLDTISPYWSKSPEYHGFYIVHFGCGPGVEVRFLATIRDQSDVWVKATVKDLKQNTCCNYYIIPDSASLSIGHSMCGGPFQFLEKMDYEASFSLMDINGNFNTSETLPIKFIGPFEEGNHPFYSNLNKITISNTMYYFLVLAITMMPISVGILVLILRRDNKKHTKPNYPK